MRDLKVSDNGMKPHMGDIGETNSKHVSIQLLGVLGFRHFGLNVVFVSSHQPFSGGGGAIAPSVEYRTKTCTSGESDDLLGSMKGRYFDCS